MNGLYSLRERFPEYRIPNPEDVEIPEEKKNWFEKRRKELQERYPYRTEREIADLALTEMSYQLVGREEPTPTIAPVTTPTIPTVSPETTPPVDNTLLKYIPSSSTYSPDITERAKFTGIPETENVLRQALLRPPPPAATTAQIAPPVAQKNRLLDYWAQPVIGKMPLDQFVQIAGTLGHAFGRTPRGEETPMGKLGAGLAQIGGAAYAERIRQEDEMRKEEAKTPTEWQALWKSLEGKIDPETNKPYEAEGKVRYIRKLTETTKEPTPQAQALVHPKTGERKWFDMNTSKGIESAQKEGFIPYEKAEKGFVPQLAKFVKGNEVIDVDMNKPEDVKKAREAGFTEHVKPEEPYKIGQRHKFTGKDGKEYEGTYLGLGTDNEPKWGSVVKIAEKPTKLTEAERDPDAHAFSAAITDAKKTEQTPLFMEKLSEAEQQRAESRLRIKTKSNYLARGGNPKKFDKFFAEGVYGVPTLDKADIVKLKEFSTPDEAISHTERAFRANMISPEVKDQAMALINKNRKKWDDWRKTQ